MALIFPDYDLYFSLTPDDKRAELIPLLEQMVVGIDETAFDQKVLKRLRRLPTFLKVNNKYVFLFFCTIVTFFRYIITNPHLISYISYNAANRRANFQLQQMVSPYYSHSFTRWRTYYERINNIAGPLFRRDDIDAELRSLFGLDTTRRDAKQFANREIRTNAVYACLKKWFILLANHYACDDMVGPLLAVWLVLPGAAQPLNAAPVNIATENAFCQLVAGTRHVIAHGYEDAKNYHELLELQNVIIATLNPIAVLQNKVAPWILEDILSALKAHVLIAITINPQQ